ncbi:MAG: hypothetical protein PHU34_11295 [Candidatus Methanoperedens sp.]|nr:hypothetical protein [Candidatus Methanoperedens sp.]
MPDSLSYSLNQIGFSLDKSGRELDSLTREVKQYGFWLGLEAPNNVMEYAWALPKITVPTVFKAAAAKVTTFVQAKVIAPVQKAATVIKQVQTQAAKVAGAAVTSTVNTLKAVKNQGVALVAQAKTAVTDAAAKAAAAAKAVAQAVTDKAKAAAALVAETAKKAKDAATALALKAKEAAMKVAAGLDALKKNLSSRISANINKFVTTGQNLLNSARGKVTSSSSHLAKAKAALARLKAKVAAKRARKMGFASFEDAIQSDPDYIQFGYEVQQGKGDIVAAQGDANGSVAATSDIEQKAGAGVTVAPEEASSIGGFISSTLSTLYNGAKSIILAIYNAGKSVLLTVAEYLGLYSSLESQMTQAILQEKKADAEVKKAVEAQASATTPEEKAVADTAYASAVTQKEAAVSAVDNAVADAIKTGASPQEAVDKMNTLKTALVPEWKPPAYTPAEQAAAPQIASDAAVSTQEKYAAAEKGAYTDLADKAGTAMAVETDLANAKTASDVNAIGAAVEEGLAEGAPEREGAPSKLPYIAAGLAVLGGGLYLLTKKKGGSYARA